MGPGQEGREAEEEKKLTSTVGWTSPGFGPASVVMGNSSSLPVGALERFGRTNQRVEGMMEDTGKPINQSTALGAGVRCCFEQPSADSVSQSPLLPPLAVSLFRAASTPCQHAIKSGGCFQLL